MSKHKQSGFTIIELLIATVVFATILLVVTFSILSIGRIYYKSINSSKTQETARSVMDEVAKSIQFSGGDIGPGKPNSSDSNSLAYCVGGRRYSYKLDVQVEKTANSVMHQGPYGLVADSLFGCTPNATQAQDLTSSSLPTKSQETLGIHMRVSKFDISQPDSVNYPNLWKVTIRVVYGDDDLLCSPSQGNCSNTNPTNFTHIPPPDDLKCRSETGSQFCSVSELSTVVEKRVP